MDQFSVVFSDEQFFAIRGLLSIQIDVNKELLASNVASVREWAATDIALLTGALDVMRASRPMEVA